MRTLPTEARERLRRNSKTLFGNRDRLEVALAIAASEDGVVNATDLSDEIGMVNNRVRAQLLALADVGLLTAMPAAGSSKRFFVRTNDSSFWTLCVQLAETWGASDGSLA